MSSHFNSNAAAASRLRRTQQQQPTSRTTTTTTTTAPSLTGGGASNPHYQTTSTSRITAQQAQQQPPSTTTSVRRNLFKTLKTASANMAGAGSRAKKQYLQPMSRRKGIVETPSDTVLDDEDVRMKDEEEDILERGPDGLFAINLPDMNEMDDDDEDEEEEKEPLRLADLLKQHGKGDIKRILPEILRLQVQSLQEDNWMYEQEDTF